MDPASIILRDLQPGDLGWVVMRHGEGYAASDGFDQSFEMHVAQLAAAYVEGRDPRTDRAWIAARPDGARLGSIFCTRHDNEAARLRMFWVEPAARGLGVGRRLLSACLDHATACGFGRLVLWTHESHARACVLYARTGFELLSAEPKVSYGQPVVEQVWAKSLRAMAAGPAVPGLAIDGPAR